ncbi:hypothetical protein FOA43_001457 [Brettanomyces nanus]|uniref:Uncharacterized protein n=1 Tax=Eeniella nana TaxID=13502 RepID=A0A875S1C1_EENNA|nr:uncharacterized protein FOA43_001457 [Brettanomyces nanus]QPG74135.1 hypothetical protein FOA43_001457 [Brettanomyces nanus]
MTSTLLLRRADSDSKCNKKNSSSQYCETGQNTSALVISLAVVIPVVVIGIIVGFFTWKAYRRNKKEALEDDDPDFNGDNIVLPDIAKGGDLDDTGRYRYPPTATNSSIQLPQPAAENPFNDPTNRSPGSNISHNNNSNTSRTGPFPPSSYYRNASQMSLAHSFHNPVDSIVIPFAEETGSKRSLEDLSRQLGGDYGGYRLSERKLNSEGAPTLPFSRRSSSIASNSSKCLTTASYEQDPHHETHLNTTQAQKHDTFNEDLSRPEKVHAKQPLQISTVKSQFQSYSDPRDNSNGEHDKLSHSSLEDKPVSATELSDKGHCSDATSSDVDRSNGTHSMSQMTYQTPSESISRIPSREYSLSGKLAQTEVEMPATVEDASVWEHSEHENTKGLAFDRSSGNSVIQPDGDEDKTIGLKVKLEPKVESVLPENADLPDLSAAADKYDEAVSPEEEEQIRRMKSVYKVYFSRDNSVRSKSSRSDKQRFEVNDEEAPPLPDMPNVGNQLQQNEKYLQDTTSKPMLSVDTINNPDKEANRMSTASYSSSVYVPTADPNPNEGYYPHQQIQFMMDQQQQQQQRQMQARMTRQRYGQAVPPPQAQQLQRQPSEVPIKVRTRNLEQLPSPHQFSNRKSTLDTFTEFDRKRSLPRATTVGSSPSLTPNLEQVQWNQAPANPSPHHIDESMMIHGPVEIAASKHYMPKGSLEDQVRKLSSSASINQSLPSPSLHHNAFSPMSGSQAPQGQEGLIPHSGADLRRQMGKLNL